MLLDPLHYAIDTPDFECLFFRRTYPEITSPGGLQSTSQKLYPLYGAQPIGMEWRFPIGAKIFFRHLQHESDIYKYQGSQIQVIYFDELTHFTRTQFTYFFSRNRNPTQNGIEPYIRASCNPDPDSWLAEFLSWWIDQEELTDDGLPNPNYGFPIKEREGVLRYLTLENDNEVWGNTAQEVIDQVPHQFSGKNADTRPLSVTFIPGDIYGNKILLEQDPKYLGSLLAMSAEEQQKLLKGNWKARVSPDSLYNSAAVGSIHSNYPPAHNGRYITADIARFGHDWTVIMVWFGWEIVGCIVMKVNDSPEAVNAIEWLRKQFGVMEHDVVVDQNGVGGEVLALRPGYRGFVNQAQPLKDLTVKVVENYKNLKTQCYYKSSYRVNAGGLRMSLNNDNVWVYESVPVSDSPTNKAYNHSVKTGCMTKRGGATVDIRDIIKKELRAIKKIEMDAEKKLQINDKAEQKVILGGWSPDFADCIMMREYFELVRPPREIRGANND
ncbi:hypothetical protein GCM10028810_02110 [Spirosoma litoris]